MLFQSIKKKDVKGVRGFRNFMKSRLYFEFVFRMRAYVCIMKRRGMFTIGNWVFIGYYVNTKCCYWKLDDDTVRSPWIKDNILRFHTLYDLLK